MFINIDSVFICPLSYDLLSVAVVIREVCDSEFIGYILFIASHFESR